MSHFDQRNANNGNQLSVEPPSQGLAVANGYVVEGVNNAFQVYTAAGVPLLPQVLSTNQVFGLPPALNRATGIFGVFPTDIRVFYDQTINRWLVIQRAQDEDIFGNPLLTSHMYIAVSQTGDPTGIYNIYSMDTTNAKNPGCPCISDFPQVGADQFGFYVSANEFSSAYSNFVDSSILAISKAALGAGASAPETVRILVPFNTGYEFAIQPASTPPGASYFVGNGGMEYFVSSQAEFLPDSNLSVWALSNTGSLGTTNPNIVLTQAIVPALSYSTPNVATQRPGPLPYGSSLSPPGLLPLLDGGDTRILSACYAGGRLYATLATRVFDENNHVLVGGAYVILSPTSRGGVLSASVLGQGYLMASNNHVLRPAVGVNAQGRGAIVFTLVGPDYYPSAAFVPLTGFSVSPPIQIAGAGALPEDGFTGYPNAGFQAVGIARWGDYSAAVAAADGSIWMGTEYIPDAPRTPFANWGTFLFKYTP
jgi:hypothetical protein